MLIVDSPFPPYSPVEVDPVAFVDVGNIAGYDQSYSARNTVTWWFQNSSLLPHRDDDCPAIIRSDDSFVFYQAGVKHRFKGTAEAVLIDGHHHFNFYLYGYAVSQTAFEAINSFAIKHELPLWVAVMANCFSYVFEDLDEVTLRTKEAFAGMPNLNATWLTKLWDVPSDWWTGFREDRMMVNDFVEVIERVVAHEKTIYGDAK